MAVSLLGSGLPALRAIFPCARTSAASSATSLPVRCSASCTRNLLHEPGREGSAHHAEQGDTVTISAVAT